jgi:hypothetical protein
MKRNNGCFDLRYRLIGSDEWRPAMSSGGDVQEAMDNFRVDYSPSMGSVDVVEPLRSKQE